GARGSKSPESFSEPAKPRTREPRPELFRRRLVVRCLWHVYRVGCRRGGNRATCGRRPVRGLIVLGDQLRDRHHLIALFHLDQPDPLRRAADDANVAGLHAQDHPLLRDQHDLVVFEHVGHAHDLAVAIGGLDVDDADAAAALEPVLLELGALAVAVLRDRQERAARFHHFHGDHFVVFAERDATDAVGRAAHRAYVTLLEPDRHAVAGAEEHLGAAIRELDGDHRVALLDADRVDAARAWIAERAEIGLLDHALACPHHHELLAVV